MKRIIIQAVAISMPFVSLLLNVLNSYWTLDETSDLTMAVIMMIVNIVATIFTTTAVVMWRNDGANKGC